MSETHFEIPKTAGYKVIGVLVVAVLVVCGWNLNRYLAAEDKHEDKQAERMDTAQQAIQASTIRLIEINSEVSSHVARQDAHNDKAEAPGG